MSDLLCGSNALLMSATPSTSSASLSTRDLLFSSRPLILDLAQFSAAGASAFHPVSPPTQHHHASRLGVLPNGPDSPASVSAIGLVPQQHGGAAFDLANVYGNGLHGLIPSANVSTSRSTPASPSHHHHHRAHHMSAINAAHQPQAQQQQAAHNINGTQFKFSRTAQATYRIFSMENYQNVTGAES